MAFTKFTLQNFRCFQSKQALVFGIPVEGSKGSGITYIVGANNSGKTTLIEGLAIKEADKLPISWPPDGPGPEFLLYAEEVLKRKCILVRQVSHTIVENPRLQSTEIFEIISSRRHWESNANSNFAELGGGFKRASTVLNNRQNSVDVASELKFIEADNDKYAEFVALVQRVIPEFTQFAVGYDGSSEFIEYISGNGTRHKTDLLGDGVITVIRILLQLYVVKENALIIDEPELSLHPSAQKKLLEVVSEYAEKRQIIISTHSPYFISWEYLKNGATINRVVKIEDKNSTIYSIKDFSQYESLISGANWQQPYLLDEVAKEIFFSEDHILFLEGQEDVGLLRREEGFQGLNIFGYGVRGAGNFKFALKLAQDLGFQKACCVLDKGDSEDQIKADLETTFSEVGYKIIQWNKEDIRDKEAYASVEKTGYFDSNGEKKTGTGLDDFDVKLAEVIDYLSR